MHRQLIRSIVATCIVLCGLIAMTASAMEVLHTRRGKLRRKRSSDNKNDLGAWT